MTVVATAPGLAQTPSPGSTLISPKNQGDTYFVDVNGDVTQTWHGTGRPASFAYLLPDGSILRPSEDPAGTFEVAPAGGHLQRINAADVVVWDFYYTGPDYQQHHDIEPMPGGNVLLIVWERKTAAEAAAAGRMVVGSEFWVDTIVEIEPVGATGGNVVWRWRGWDHRIQDVDSTKANFGVLVDHPERLDLNSGGDDDWLHFNSIDYDPVSDHILVSSRSMGEVYVIDHSTTTSEAAGESGGNSGMGGGILYRWGNPQVYDRGAAADQYLFTPHGANWIDAGLPGARNILVFNNGDRPGTTDDYSTVDEIVPPRAGWSYDLALGTAYAPAAPVWSFGGPGFYGGATACGAFRLLNGNTLITITPDAHVFEVDSSGTTVWEYYDPNPRIIRAPRYLTGTTGLSGREGALGSLGPRLSPARPNPFTRSTEFRFTLDEAGEAELTIVDVAGRVVASLASGIHPAGDSVASWNGRDPAGQSVPSGVYFATLRAAGRRATQKLHYLPR